MMNPKNYGLIYYKNYIYYKSYIFTAIIPTVIIAAIIMFIMGQSSVKGFATMLIISILVTVIIMVYLIKYVLKIFVSTKYFDNKPGLFIGLNKFFYLSFACFIKKSAKYLIGFSGLSFATSAIPWRTNGTTV